MSQEQPWFVGERARALASLLLTSRKDVAIQQVTSDESGVDVLAELLKGTARTGRFFGVRVVGRLGPPGAETVEPDSRSLRRKHFSEFTIPLVAFLFDVRGNQGCYRWLAEPVVESGEPKLVWLDDREWAKLDEQAVGHIVDRVGVWYDALAVRLRAS
jgi:hypothetical protein